MVDSALDTEGVARAVLDGLPGGTPTSVVVNLVTPESKFITPKELFKLTGYTEATQTRMRSQGSLPYHRAIGSKVVYLRSEIYALIKRADCSKSESKKGVAVG